MARRGTRPSTCAGAGTASLFSADELDVPAPSPQQMMGGLKWSYSRRGTFESCPRQYYYQYYGSNSGTAKADPDKPLLQQLKRLRNRHAQAGQHMHTAIATYLKKARAGQSIDPKAWARRMFRDDLDYSRRDPSGLRPPNGKYPPALLQEWFYQAPNAEELCFETEARMLRALENFLSHPVFAKARAAGMEPDALIEESLGLSIGCQVTGKIDLLTFEGDGLSIVDWKMGAAGAEGDDSLQLAAYALWACRTMGKEPEDVTVYKAFLGSGDLVEFKTDADGLEAAQARILQDARRMASVDGYGHEAAVQVFTACAQPNICALCPYLRACPEGKRCCSDQDDDAGSLLEGLPEEPGGED